MDQLLSRCLGISSYRRLRGGLHNVVETSHCTEHRVGWGSWLHACTYRMVCSDRIFDMDANSSIPHRVFLDTTALLATSDEI